MLKRDVFNFPGARMKKVLVTIVAQTTIEYDELNDATYEEELEMLVSDLEDMGLSVTIDSEESVEESDFDNDSI